MRVSKRSKLEARVAELEDRVDVLEQSPGLGTVTIRIHTQGGKVLSKTVPFKGFNAPHHITFLALSHPSFVVEEITWELSCTNDYGSWGPLARGWYCDRADDVTVVGAKWLAGV